MASYYEQVQEAIKNNEKELVHLRDELRGLRSVEKDTPRESFQRQHAQILYHIEQEQRRLAENQALLDNFNATREAIAELRESRESEELDKLRALLASERDPQIRREILEELEAKELEHQAKIEALETQVQTGMAGLTDELAEELRQSFLSSEPAETKDSSQVDVVAAAETADMTDSTGTGTDASEAETADATGTDTETDTSTSGTDTETAGKEDGINGNDQPPVPGSAETTTEVEVEVELPDPRRVQLQADLDAARDELAEAEHALQQSIARFQAIFAEERTRQESEGPFATEEELDNFTNEYMRQKIEENERFEAAKARIDKARRQVKRIEERIAEHASLEEEARRYHIDIKVLEKIKSAVSKKEVLSAIYEQQGLGEVDRSTQAGRDQADKVTAEVVESIVEQLTRAGIQTGAATQGNVNQNGGININQNGGVNINIIDTVNIVYGTDIPVKAGPARTTTLTEQERETIERTQKIRIKVKVIPHNGNEQEGKTPGKAPEDMEGAQTAVAEEKGPVKTKRRKTPADINREMDKIAGRLYEDEEALRAAREDYEKAQAEGADDKTLADKKLAVDRAQNKYNQRMQRLKDKQQEYIDLTSSGDFDKVGTSKKMKLINGEEYYGDDQSVAGDITTLRVAGGKDKGRPAFTDASAKKEGQIDARTFARLLNEKYGPIPKIPKPTDPRPTETGPRPTETGPQPTQTGPQPTQTGPQPTQTGPKPTNTGPQPTQTGPQPTKTGGIIVVTPTGQVLYGPPPPTPTQTGPKPTQTGPQPTQTGPRPTQTGPQPTQTGPRPTQTGPRPTQTREPKKYRGLMTIMEELTDGLDVKAKDGKRYKASNIKVFKGFKDELCSGNFLYNIVHLVPAIVKLPFNLIRKAAGKIMLRAKSKKNIAELKKRIDKLSDEDLMTIYTEYRGNRVIQERFPTILNTLIEERMQKFVLGKVTQINTELEQRYQNAFTAIQELDAINAKLSGGSLSADERRQLEAAKRDILKGQSENIAAIRRGYVDANGWLSGGLHGFSEDMKAATTKLSLVGKRFAKDHDLDPELLKRQAALERAEMQAIAEGNDEMALRVFVENEVLLSQNTSINGSIFGRRSTGEKYYSPLVDQLDYRDDPFIRDLFTTIAVSSAAISTIQSIKAARDQAAIIAENNRRMAQNNQTMQQVNQMGQDIAGKRDVMMDGMESQGMQDTLTAANEIERAVLDKTDWGLGTKAYRTADNAGHSYYTTFYDTTKQAYENIAQQYASGQISQAQAMQLMADLGTKTHQTLGAINTECLNILKPYAATHPQFDLSGVQGAMEFIQANPNTVSAFNQAMVDVTNAGDVLASMQLQQLIPLTTLPSSIRTVIVNGAATAALAANINNSMGAKKHTYGNSVTDMVDDYEQGRAASAESNARGNTSNR